MRALEKNNDLLFRAREQASLWRRAVGKVAQEPCSFNVSWAGGGRSKEKKNSVLSRFLGLEAALHVEVSVSLCLLFGSGKSLHSEKARNMSSLANNH